MWTPIRNEEGKLGFFGNHLFADNYELAMALIKASSTDALLTSPTCNTVTIKSNIPDVLMDDIIKLDDVTVITSLINAGELFKKESNSLNDSIRRALTLYTNHRNEISEEMLIRQFCGDGTDGMNELPVDLMKHILRNITHKPMAGPSILKCFLNPTFNPNKITLRQEDGTPHQIRMSIIFDATTTVSHNLYPLIFVRVLMSRVFETTYMRAIKEKDEEECRKQMQAIADSLHDSLYGNTIFTSEEVFDYCIRHLASSKLEMESGAVSPLNYFRFVSERVSDIAAGVMTAVINMPKDKKERTKDAGSKETENLMSELNKDNYIYSLNETFFTELMFDTMKANKREDIQRSLDTIKMFFGILTDARVHFINGDHISGEAADALRTLIHENDMQDAARRAGGFIIKHNNIGHA